MSSSQLLTGAVECGVKGRAVLPAAPDDAEPGAGENADGVRMAAAAGDGSPIDVGRPRVGSAAAVGEVHHCGAQLLVTRPSEHGLFPFAGLTCRAVTLQPGRRARRRMG